MMQMDFIKVYCNELMPLLHGLESKRKKLRLINIVFQLLGILTVVSSFACIILGCFIPEKMTWFHLSDINMAILSFLLPVVIAIFALVIDKIMRLTRDLTKKAKKVYFDNILKSFGYNVSYINYANSNDININYLLDIVDKINEFDLFPQFAHLNITDEIKGTYNKTRFSLMLLELFFSGRVILPAGSFFKGIVLKFKTKRKMKEDIYICTKGEYLGISPWIVGTFVVLSVFCFVSIFIAAYVSKDAIFIFILPLLLISLFIVAFLIFGNIKRFKKIKINDKNLAKQYSLFADEYSDGDIDEDVLFDDDLLKTFDNIRKVYKTNKIKMLWSKSDIVLAINVKKNMFEFDSGNKSFIDPEIIKDFYSKLSIVFDIIDSFNKNQSSFDEE